MARARKGFGCVGCGQPLGFEDEGKRCRDCSKPAVVQARKALSAVRRADRDEVVLPNLPETDSHGPGLCEDAAHCLTCRERMGLALPAGLG